MTDIVFEDSELVAFANLVLQNCAADLRVTAVKERGDNYLQFEVEGGKGAAATLVAPVAAFRNGVIGMRSFLKRRTRTSTMTWLCNGQASRGCTEIAFLGEEGPKLAASKSAMRAYVMQVLPADAPERVRSYREDLAKAALDSGFYGECTEVIDCNGDRIALDVLQDLTPRP